MIEGLVGILAAILHLTNWIKVLSNDVKAIFWASARASEAVAYLNDLQDQEKSTAQPLRNVPIPNLEWSSNL